MQEWLIWLPWKGSGPARGPRVRIPPFPPMRKKTINEIASERCAELWRKYYEEHPKEYEKLKENVRKAEEFTKKLREDFRKYNEEE